MKDSDKNTKRKVLEWIGAAILALFIIGMWPESEARVHTAAGATDSKGQSRAP